MAGWLIEVPVGWACALDEQHRWVRLTAGRVEVSLEHIEVDESIDLTAFGAAQMRRHVPVGADYVLAVLGGQATRRYQWTDGVELIETTFVTVPGVQPPAILRVDVAAAVLFEGDALAPLRDQVAAMLASLAWR